MQGDLGWSCMLSISLPISSPRIPLMTHLILISVEVKRANGWLRDSSTCWGFPKVFASSSMKNKWMVSDWEAKSASPNIQVISVFCYAVAPLGVAEPFSRWINSLHSPNVIWSLFSNVTQSVLFCSVFCLLSLFHSKIHLNVLLLKNLLGAAGSCSVKLVAIFGKLRPPCDCFGC